MKRITSGLLVCGISISGVAAAQEQPAQSGQPRTDTGEAPENKEANGSSPGGLRVGVEGDFNDGITKSLQSGYGGALRVGQELDLLILSLTPEIMGDIHQFSGPGDPLQYSGQAGFRLTFAKIVEPGIFAHAGVGHADLPGDNLTGFALDTGVTLDLTVIPYVDLGVHGAYDLLTWGGEGTLNWYRLGGHVVFAP